MPKLNLGALPSIRYKRKILAYKAFVPDRSPTSSPIPWEHRVTGDQKILEEIHGNVMVIDEKWLYADPMPLKENNRAWVEPGGDPETSSKTHCWQEISYQQFSKNHEFSMWFLLRDFGPRWDYECAAIDLILRKFEGIHRIPQPPYSPDMNLLDWFIFRNMESKRIHQKLENFKAVKRYLSYFFCEQKRSSFNNELLTFLKDLQAIIDGGGDYLWLVRLFLDVCFSF